MFKELKKEQKVGIYFVAAYWLIVLATLVFAIVQTDKWSGGYQYVPFILVTIFPFVTFLQLAIVLSTGVDPLEDQFAIAGAIGCTVNSATLYLFGYGAGWLIKRAVKKDES